MRRGAVHRAARTGKAAAAEAVARELGQDLHRIDLSAVVSKHVGATEKNLASAFDEAERGSAVLVFDEADALFGKRTEIRDAHDRYANLEANYLLRRVETFTGSSCSRATGSRRWTMPSSGASAS
jgi:SpoVK/Ycf46/Vps4 family AAA+-type ATPase